MQSAPGVAVGAREHRRSVAERARQHDRQLPAAMAMFGHGLARRDLQQTHLRRAVGRLDAQLRAGRSDSFPADRLDVTADIVAQWRRDHRLRRPAPVLRRNARTEPVAHAGPRIGGDGHGRHSLEQRAAGGFCGGKPGAALRTERKVRAHGKAPPLGKASRRVAEQQIVIDMVARHHAVSPPSADRSFATASRIRDFTVPSGTDKAAAMSDCDRSSK